MKFIVQKTATIYLSGHDAQGRFGELIKEAKKFLMMTDPVSCNQCGNATFVEDKNRLRLFDWNLTIDGMSEVKDTSLIKFVKCAACGTALDEPVTFESKTVVFKFYAVKETDTNKNPGPTTGPG